MHTNVLIKLLKGRTRPSVGLPSLTAPTTENVIIFCCSNGLN